MYSSSLTDDEWLIIEPLLPKKKLTCPLTWTKREILDGVFYQLKNGCNWGDLPKDFLPYSTIYWHYKQWQSQGIIQEIMETLHKRLRHQEEKNLWTTLIIIDSQAVKNTCNASVETKKAEKGLSGFVPVKTRWVVERSNAWMDRCKSLVKNFERTLAHAATKIHLCFLRLLLRRLAVSWDTKWFLYSHFI